MNFGEPPLGPKGHNQTAASGAAMLKTTSRTNADHRFPALRIAPRQVVLSRRRMTIAMIQKILKNNHGRQFVDNLFPLSPLHATFQKYPFRRR